MSHRWTRSILNIACLAVVCTCIILISRGQSSMPSNGAASPLPTANRHRNSFLQPDALTVGRQLGKRFNAGSRSLCTVVGTLTVGSNQQIVRMARRHLDAGETVEVHIGNHDLRWSGRAPLSSTSEVSSDAERLITERLVLDSPDQFVLAQVRGASYFTVARNVRPTDAGEDYNGPLWNLVRVTELEQQDENVRPLSSWRIYYINTQTGLPDRIDYQLNGRDIRTDFVEWNEQNGEKTPSLVRWSSGRQVLMEYQAQNISYDH